MKIAPRNDCTGHGWIGESQRHGAGTASSPQNLVSLAKPDGITQACFQPNRFMTARTGNRFDIREVKFHLPFISTVGALDGFSFRFNAWLLGIHLIAFLLPANDSECYLISDTMNTLTASNAFSIIFEVDGCKLGTGEFGA